MPVRITYEPGYAYFITKNVKNRQPVFTIDRNVRLLLADFEFYREKFGYRIYAWVIMPDHYHWIIDPSHLDFINFVDDQIERQGKYHKDPPKYYLSSRMESLHSHVAQMINQAQGTVGKRLWQRGFHDRLLRDADALEKAIEYIHNNPVKAGLCEAQGDYPWSSYHAFYHDDHDMLQLDPLPF